MPTKKIWMYWGQGWENAPDLVAKCRASWERLNPDYEVIALDDASLGGFIDIPLNFNARRPDVTLVIVSDYIRVALLAKYGGVWADATVMCTKPLETWLPEYYSSGFFAFRNPGKDRLISSWFMACEPRNPLMVRISKEYSDFFVNNTFPNQTTLRGKLLRSFFRKRWNKKISTTLNWHSEFARNTLKTYPYFIFHYTVNKIILEDSACARILYDAKPYDVAPCHKLQQFSRQSGGLAKALAFLSSTTAPMHKLNRRRDMEQPYWRGVMKVIEPHEA